MNSVIVCVVLCSALASANIFVPNIVPLKDLRESGSRIISGKPAVPGQFPHQVANRFGWNSPSSFCGGALICDSWVLTAAHCAQNANYFSLYLGSVNQSQSVEVGRVELVSRNAIVHERYNSFNLNNDVALIRLDRKVNFTKNIQPIPLARTRTPDNSTLTVSGWGLTRAGGGVSPILNYVDLRSISNKECAGVYGSSVVINSTICCRGNPEHSTCNGDSGGPLIAKNSAGKLEHVGVVSFVNARGCASGNPSGYVRTESLRSWIVSKINGTCVLP